MHVFVIGLNGIGLMPTKPSKARKLLKAGKATVAWRHPFTIRLNYKTGSATQGISLGIDTGESHIGASVTRDGHVLCKDEVILRPSMEKRTLMETRKTYRRGRRYRKTRYRHPKFRFHTKRVYCGTPDRKGRHWQKVPNTASTGRGRGKGWLPPSISSKVEHHIHWIRKYQMALPKNAKTIIEAARFDIQRMKDPTVHGELYQRGRMYSYENVKAYVLARFSYKCPVCGKKFDKGHRPRLHHVTYRSKGATDNPDEYAPVCEKCHGAEAHKTGGALDKLRRACRRKEYREPAFMNILRRRLYSAFPDAGFTYGNITNADRKRIGLEKSHANDAAAIALRDCEGLNGPGNIEIIDDNTVTYIKQVRSKRRSLHEANPRKGRKGPNRTAKRSEKNITCINGFSRHDKVRTRSGKVGYISGFTGTNAYVVSFEGGYIIPCGKSYKQHTLNSLLRLQGNNYNWIQKTEFIPPSKANGIPS